jgi:hypothetical protein
MIQISPWEYEQFLAWVISASNYAGRTPHDAEGEGHCLDVDGRKIEAAWSGPDNVTYERDTGDRILHMADEQVYQEWLRYG